MAQNEVYNYFRSRPLSDFSVPAIMPWPGEYRFPGGRQKADEDQSPLDTVIRHFNQLFPQQGQHSYKVKPSDVRATLAKKTISKHNRNIFHVCVTLLHITSSYEYSFKKKKKKCVNECFS